MRNNRKARIGKRGGIGSAADGLAGLAPGRRPILDDIIERMARARIRTCSHPFGSIVSAHTGLVRPPIGGGAWRPCCPPQRVVPHVPRMVLAAGLFVVQEQ